MMTHNYVHLAQVALLAGMGLILLPLIARELGWFWRVR